MTKSPYLRNGNEDLRPGGSGPGSMGLLVGVAVVIALVFVLSWLVK